MLFFTPIFTQNDKPNCKDHPLITRYPGAEIGWCSEESFSQYHLAVGPQTGYRQIDDWIDLEGKVFRTYYTIKTGATVNDVYQNYRNSIQRGGFKILAKGLNPTRNVGKEVGGNTWIRTFYSKNPFPVDSDVRIMSGSATSAGAGFVAGLLDRPSGKVYIGVSVYQYSSEEVLVVQDIVETGSLEDGKVTVDADYIAREIELNGTVALYGIYFDFDKADIKPESKEALEAIAEYLKKHSDVNLYIVGHTDMKGTVVYNLSLSEKRATAVVDKLVSDYGISRGRLEGKGVGPFSPKSNNTSEEGRKLNRRVELVKKIN